MIDRLIEIGRCCRMETNVEKTKVMRISRQQSPIQIMIDQKQLENVNYLDSMITNVSRCTREIKFRIAMAKAAFIKKKTLFTGNWTNIRKKPDDVNMWGGSIHTIKKNTEALVVTSKEIGLEVNAEKTKCTVMSRDQHAGQNHDIKIGNKSFD
jgi:hypothetical protein